MPRNVRNFWLKFHADGAARDLVGGPRNADGGFSGSIYMREGGDVSAPIRLAGWSADGANFLKIDIPDGMDVTVENGGRSLVVRNPR